MGNGEPMIAVVVYGTIVALYLVLVASWVASTSVKAAPCERGKGSPTTVTLLAVVISSFLWTEAEALPCVMRKTSPLVRRKRHGGWQCLLNPAVAATRKM